MWVKLADGEYQDVNVAGANRILIDRPSRRKVEPVWSMAVRNVDDTTFYYNVHSDYIDAIKDTLDEMVMTQLQDGEVGEVV